MMKSYTPLRPTPKRRPPPWVDGGSTRRMILSTDDTEFGVCHVERTNARVRRVAYQNGRGHWLEVQVDWRRVKEAA
jgi:hypothetical protein